MNVLQQALNKVTVVWQCWIAGFSLEKICCNKGVVIVFQAIDAFENTFGRRPSHRFTAPGRTELGGNHTDHQHGRVLAAAVNLESVAYVAENGTDCVRVESEGFARYEVSLKDLAINPAEFGTTRALIRGVAAQFVKQGHRIGGFDAYITSSVLPGSGLSSSAAFEVLVGTIFNGLFVCGRTKAEIAQFGQYAENVYFGKPCGLMDQMACAMGNMIAIDFQDPAEPVVTTVDFDFSSCGYALCMIDSGGNHADLTEEYAAIPRELEMICAVFGQKFLRDVPEQAFYDRLPQVRKAAGDRASLRAMHFYEDNRRVAAQVQALERQDFCTFLHLVRDSGRSSWMYLQNVIPSGATSRQETAFALALTEKLLGGQGACRIHGGGFAGTIQAFVPNDRLEDVRKGLEAVLGLGSCHVTSIRKVGSTMEVL